MQTHRDSSDWPTYEVTIKITVKAEDYKAAKGCYRSVVCGNQEGGRDWELIQTDRSQVRIVPQEIDPQIRVTKREVT